MKHVFSIPEEYSFEKIGIKGKTFESKELNDKVEFTIIETERGHETRILEKECRFNYFVLEGEGRFEINGEIENCAKGDLVVIPKGTPFQYFGKMKLLLVVTPWWFEDQEETLK